MIESRLDVWLVGLIGLGLLIAGVLAGIGQPVPDLVEYVVIGCLGAIGARRTEKRRSRHGDDTA